MTPEQKQKLLELALRFIARQHLLGKFDDYLTCNVKNGIAERDVEQWLTRRGGWKERVSDEQLEKLRREAFAAGDLKQVRLCDGALRGDEDARADCARVIDDATAQEN